MWQGRHNYELNSATVLRDLYRLVAMVVADQGLMNSAGGPDPLKALRGLFLEDELVHLLVGTAVANRIQLEHMSGPRDEPGMSRLMLKIQKRASRVESLRSLCRLDKMRVR
jgi:hypothetical protein